MEGSMQPRYDVSLHISTVFLLVCASIHLLAYLRDRVGRSGALRHLRRLVRKQLRKASQGRQGSAEAELGKRVEHVKKKIEKLNRIIEANKNENKNANEYELLLLNGKYTRQLLKEQKELQSLLEEQKRRRAQYVSSNLLWRYLDNANNFYHSNNSLIKQFRYNLMIILLFVICRYVILRNAREVCFKLHTSLRYSDLYPIEFSDKCRRNLLHFLYNVNLTNLFLKTFRMNFKHLVGWKT